MFHRPMDTAFQMPSAIVCLICIIPTIRRTRVVTACISSYSSSVYIMCISCLVCVWQVCNYLVWHTHTCFADTILGLCLTVSYIVHTHLCLTSVYTFCFNTLVLVCVWQMCTLSSILLVCVWQVCTLYVWHTCGGLWQVCTLYLWHNCAGLCLTGVYTVCLTHLWWVVSDMCTVYQCMSDTFVVMAVPIHSFSWKCWPGWYLMHRHCGIVLRAVPTRRQSVLQLNSRHCWPA